MVREVKVGLGAQDRGAMTMLRGVGYAFLMLGHNIAFAGRQMGEQGRAMEMIGHGLAYIGHAIQLVRVAYILKAAAIRLCSTAQVEETTVTGAAAGAQLAHATAAGSAAGANMTLAGSAQVAATANLGLAASFKAVMLAMGPWGWALMGISALLAGIAGYALAGGFAPRQAAAGVPGVGRGPFQEPMVKIEVNVAELRTKRDVAEVVEDMGSLWYEQYRKYSAR